MMRALPNDVVAQDNVWQLRTRKIARAKTGLHHALSQQYRYLQRSWHLQMTWHLQMNRTLQMNRPSRLIHVLRRSVTPFIVTICQQAGD